MSASPRLRSSKRSPSRTAELSDREARDKCTHAVVDGIANRPRFFQRLTAGVQKSPVFNWSAQSEAVAVSATHGYDSGSTIGKYRRHQPRFCGCQVESDFEHHLDNVRLNACGWPHPRGIGPSATRSVTIEQRRSHLTTPGVINTDKQDARSPIAEYIETVTNSAKSGHANPAPLQFWA